MLEDLEAFKNWLRPQITAGSHGTYVSLLKRWSVYLDGHQPTKEAAEEFLSYRKHQGLSDSSIASYMAVLEKYFDWKDAPITFTLPELVQVRVRRALQSKEHRRRNFICQRIDGRSVMVPSPGKRARPKGCKLCGAVCKLLYHHWDNEDYSKGLWLCNRCHMVAEAAESGILSSSYFSLKQSVDREVS